MPNPKITADAKPYYKAALKANNTFAALWLDAGLAGYLLNPNASDYAVERQLAQHGLSLPAAEAPQKLLPLVRECLGLSALSPLLERELEANGQQKLLREVEQPLCEVLASMELTGFRVDREGLREFGIYLDGLTIQLEQEIYQLAGGKFNINSPKQLGDVLFGKLELPAKKKTKSGYSTNAEVLEELIPYHPIISKILEYRKYKKLSSTYVEGLKDTIGPDSRIRSVFRQTDTRTGRISSAEPNMQNIPIRTEPGSRMRDFFEAEEGNLLVDADYSQIELRVLAALANDSAMIEAFREGVDIHTRTAAQVFDLPEAFVTPQMRSRAKAVNFGIVYGIGAFSLSRDIGVSMQEADTYIKNYKKTYSGIAAYLERAIEDAKEKGYAEKDPTADVEGHDACRKVCILASLAFGKHVYPNQVETEGITNITLEDVSYIENAGGVIKLLGQIKYINDNEIAAFVSPAVVYNGSQLASVKDVFNAILVRGDAVGDVCFYGPGAGKLPTASAVVADIIDCAKHSERKKIFGWGAGAEDYVVDYKERIEMPFYVRAKATPAEINAKFSDVKFLSRKGQPSDEVAFITDIMTENKLNKKLDGINVINTIKVTNY